ncbi:MAG: M36 family metallopeptidase [Wenzhouxiangellaceae bacterium]
MSQAHAIEPELVARQALQAQARQFDLQPADIEDVEITDVYQSRGNGVTHVWMRQRIDGIPVALGLANANVSASGEILSLHSSMSPAPDERMNHRLPSIDAETALRRYAAARDLDFGIPPRRIAQRDAERMTFSGGSMADGQIPVQLAWLEYRQRLHLVWDVAVDEAGRSDWINAFIDAHSGEILKTVNWTQHADYRVFPDPLEHPGEGDDALLSDPADSSASPNGWHDDGSEQFTDTRGNNVLAQEDSDANNTGGRRPDGGAGLVFDFPVDLTTQQPSEYEDFAITNLFFWNNRLHDVLWHHGFDEVAGNFQQSNFGLGGTGGDAVRADAQDGSGTNNANFSSPPDGIPGRMQMFVWTGSSPSILRVAAPAESAGDYIVNQAGFGPLINAAGPEAVLELVNDGSTSPDEGCNVLQGFTAGNIALVRRGTCEFGSKALNAEQAGAVAVIVVNNDGGNGTLDMAGGAQGGQVSIPSAMIGNADGDLIINDANAPVAGQLFRPDAPDLNRDSDLDAGVIAHEYGHGLSIRLTGGPSQSSCLSGAQQAGEGWSDFLALWMTAKVGDSPDLARGIGSYVIFQENTAGAGIRPAPYTRDMQQNPLLYESIRSAGQPGSPISIPHGVGTVFASAVWDMYLNLVEKHGFDPDLTRGSGGNNIALQLVIDGLKMQPCAPTFLDTRDAMLLADRSRNAGANQCEIWQAFARRGMGEDANDGGSSGSLDVTNGFGLPSQCQSDAIFNDGFESARSSSEARYTPQKIEESSASRRVQLRSGWQHSVQPPETRLSGLPAPKIDATLESTPVRIRWRSA